MEGNRTPRLALLLLFVLAAFPLWAESPPQPESPVTVTLGVNHAPPYRILNEQEPTGLYIDIFREMADRLGWSLEFREAPFRRVLLMAREGEVDILLGPMRTEERVRSLAFLAPAFPPEPKLFFYRHPEDRIDTYDDLLDKRVGVLEGAVYFPRFDSDERLTKESAPRYENLMLMLEKDRVDVVIAPELVGWYTVRQTRAGARASPYIVPGEPSYIAVSRRSPVIEHGDKLRKALEEIKAEGTYDRLVKRYRQSDSIPSP